MLISFLRLERREPVTTERGQACAGVIPVVGAPVEEEGLERTG